MSPFQILLEQGRRWWWLYKTLGLLRFLKRNHNFTSKLTATENLVL